MTWQELYAAIDKGALSGAYLFHGEEEYIKADALSKLRARLLPSGLEALNETTLDASASAQSIIEAAETLPAFCEKRLVVVRDWAIFGTGKTNGEAEEIERMTKWLPGAPDTCVIVFYSRGVCGAGSASVKKLRACLTETRFSPLDDATLRKWTRQKAKESGKSLSDEAFDALVFAAGNDLTRLAGEIGKLCAYAGDRAEISASDVRSLVKPTPESTIFEMVDALTAGRYGKAQSLYALLLNAGTQRVYILYMITRQARLLYHAGEMLQEKKGLAEIQSALEIRSSYGARKLLDQARRASPESLKRAYRECVLAEYSIKSGAARDVAALGRILLLLSTLYSGGKT